MIPTTLTRDELERWWQAYCAALQGIATILQDSAWNASFAAKQAGAALVDYREHKSTQKEEPVKTFLVYGKRDGTRSGEVETIAENLASRQAADRAVCEAISQGWYGVEVEESTGEEDRHGA